MAEPHIITMTSSGATGSVFTFLSLDQTCECFTKLKDPTGVET